MIAMVPAAGQRADALSAVTAEKAFSRGLGGQAWIEDARLVVVLLAATPWGGGCCVGERAAAADDERATAPDGGRVRRLVTAVLPHWRGARRAESGASVK